MPDEDLRAFKTVGFCWYEGGQLLPGWGLRKWESRGWRRKDQKLGVGTGAGKEKRWQ